MGLFDSINLSPGSSTGMKIFDPSGTVASVTGGNKFSGGISDLNKAGTNPLIDSLKDQVKNMPGFQPLTSKDYGTAYQAHDYSNEALPQYDAMRTRLNSQYSQNQQEAQDSIDRQFAAAGGGPGNGAQAKQTENLAAATEKQKGSDLQDINAQESQTRMALNEQEKQRAYESGEALKGRSFQGEMFNRQSIMQEGQFKFSANSTIAQLDQGWKEAQAEASNNEFNRQLAEFQAQHSGGLLGGGGILGTGLFS